jgi:type IX secretion system PorP/SprF family membrane protein
MVRSHLFVKRKKQQVMVKYRLLFMLLLLMGFGISNNRAQEALFTDISEAHLLINPARLTEQNQPVIKLQYRNMPLTENIRHTALFAATEIPFHYSYKKINGGILSLGFYNESYNSYPAINTSMGTLAFAQAVQITSNSILSLAMQCNFYQKILNKQNFTTGSQWDPYLGYNPSLPSGENFITHKAVFYTLNTGIFLKQIKNNSTHHYIGFSVYNLNRPALLYTSGGTASRLPNKYFLIVGYKIFDRSDINLIPEFLFSKYRNEHTIYTGLQCNIATYASNPFLPFDDGWITVSGQYANNRSLSVGLALSQPRYKAGIVYQHHFLSEYYREAGSVELLLVFKFGKKKSAVPPAQEYRMSEVRRFFKIDNIKDTARNIKQEEQQPQVEKHKPVSLALKRDFKFSFNDATLNDEAKQYLDELADLLKRSPQMTIEIIGHTDDVGTPEGNRIISLRRAQVVADYLISKGIGPERIKVTGKMDKEPLFPNNSPENRSKNRRVEFILTQ